MTVNESGWVVCSPGDPTDLQWEVMRACAGDHDFCAERWNADTGEVAFTVCQPHGGDAHYTVDLNGELCQTAT